MNGPAAKDSGTGAIRRRAARLAGKRVIVTGAGSGIGRASAIRFAVEGATVLAVDRESRGLRKTLEAIGDAGGRGVAEIADVGREAAVAALVRRCIGGLEVMFANAGIAGAGLSLLEQTVPQWEEVLRVNLIGVFLCVEPAARHMVGRRRRIDPVHRIRRRAARARGRQPLQRQQSGRRQSGADGRERARARARARERHLPRPGRDRYDARVVRAGARARKRAQHGSAHGVGTTGHGGGDGGPRAFPGEGRVDLCHRSGDCLRRRLLEHSPVPARPRCNQNTTVSSPRPVPGRESAVRGESRVSDLRRGRRSGRPGGLVGRRA
jgi:NAD(P)-dependent dehydrogenase (short-subunit alcohol dehydrogenase family)